MDNPKSNINVQKYFSFLHFFMNPFIIRLPFQKNEALIIKSIKLFNSRDKRFMDRIHKNFY